MTARVMRNRRRRRREVFPGSDAIQDMRAAFGLRFDAIEKRRDGRLDPMQPQLAAHASRRRRSITTLANENANEKKPRRS